MAKRILVQHKTKEWIKGEIVDTILCGNNIQTPNFVISMPNGDFYYDSIYDFKRIKTLKEKKK